MATSTLVAPRRSSRRNLIRHFFEMVLAMMVGMAVLGMIERVICAALGQAGFFDDHDGLWAPLMAMNMTVGMAAWMRYRGHGWAPIGEMSAAMFAPVALLIAPFWAGVVSGDTLLGGTHMLMIPAMVLAMLHRRDEYAEHHHRRLSPSPSPSAT